MSINPIRSSLVSGPAAAAGISAESVKQISTSMPSVPSCGKEAALASSTRTQSNMGVPMASPSARMASFQPATGSARLSAKARWTAIASPSVAGMRPSACTAAREIFAPSRLAVMKLSASFSIATIASMVPVCSRTPKCCHDLTFTAKAINAGFDNIADIKDVRARGALQSQYAASHAAGFMREQIIVFMVDSVTKHKFKRLLLGFLSVFVPTTT
ncbi:exported hypothetical protein [Agrobacterium deltaense Zutra 3/1]|uniref:Uncharacterized protein n=1 Tax=Agrobacterium deltaense Zutra 3/1 TaxID=1183427 RepID=A0A1S7RLB9_9HYPH|nr:exported hypothetical protein [Agrobacterium deltaense Zutra 3/1]